MRFILAFDNAYWKENPQMVFPIIGNNSISFERAQNNTSFEAINGEMVAIGKLNLATFTVESIFPNRKYPWIASGAKADGWYYVRLIEKVRERQIPFRAVHLDSQGKEIFNVAAVVDSFAYSVDVAGDINYSISFKEYRFSKTGKAADLNVTKNLVEAEKTASVAVSNSSVEAQTASGDTSAAGTAPANVRYTEADAKLMAEVFYGEARGFHVGTKMACVGWTILNRVDSPLFAENTISATITKPAQFADEYGRGKTKNDFGENLVDFAKDVMNRWSREKAGESNVGRVLPKDYFYYGGTGDLSFRKAYSTSSQHWDYSLPSPYSVMR